VRHWGLRFALATALGCPRREQVPRVPIFNLINAAATLTYSQTFVPNGAWLAPTAVLTPRFVKVRVSGPAADYRIGSAVSASRSCLRAPARMFRRP
jgi:hypothetical protein